MRKKITLALLSLLLVPLGMMAQNVTVSPNTGSMIPSMTNSYTETGWASGAFATWIHKQLPLVITVGDEPGLTPDGLLETHANNLYPNSASNLSAETDNPFLVMVGGMSANGYVTVSLPNGYRFTSYRIVLTNNVTKAGTLSAGTSTDIKFGEATPGYRSWSFTNVSGTYANMGKTDGGATKEYTVTRKSTSSSDMGNILYFMLQDGAEDAYQTCAFKYIELEFSPEAPFTTSVKPSSTISSGVSYTTTSFGTGKQDFGTIEERTYDNATRVGYFYSDVEDLPANVYLYEEEAIGTDKLFPTTDIGNKTITTSGDYYKLAGGTKGQVYYVETPEEGTITKVSYTNTGEVHYRIVDATINYTAATSSEFYIQYTADGTTYYLQTDGTWGTTKTLWTIDGYGRISSGGYYLTYYTEGGMGNRRYYLKTSTSDYAYFNINDNNQIYYDGWNDYYIIGGQTQMSTSTSGAATAYSTAETGQLVIYGTDGDTPEKTINITGTGSYTFSSNNIKLNNDAVKFKVVGTALVNVDLQMQALDPFIESVDVQLDAQKGEYTYTASQTFTAGDFKVNNADGAVCTFVIPTNMAGGTVSVNYANLENVNKDDTYSGGSSDKHSRYNFVKSDYFNLHNEENGTATATTGSAAIAWMGSNNVYVDKANVASYDYTKKVNVAYAGTIPYTFNNAGTYETEASQSGSTKFTENSFRLDRYKAQGGSFTQITANTSNFPVTAYLFVTDETRYNLAPTTNVQHRSHAYFDVNLAVETADFTTSARLEPIYEHTFTPDGDKAYYGAVVSSTRTGVSTYGSVSITDAVNAVKAVADAAKVGYDQILYLDFATETSGLYTSATTTEGKATEWASIKETFTTPNLVAYLPLGTTSDIDNFAYRQAGTSAMSFQTGADVVLTDKYPFFTKYDISVGTGRVATYSREITVSMNGKVKCASVILPYKLTVDDNGVHTNKDGLCSFSVNALNTDNAIGLDKSGSDADYIGYFSPVEEANANTPYMVNVLTAPGDETISFIAIEQSPTIVSTSTMGANYLFTGEEVTGVSVEGTSYAGTYSFTNYGGYSGKEYQKADVKIFYFAGGMYRSSESLTKSSVKVYPFRGVYDYSGSTLTAKGMPAFNIAFGENPDEPTAIKNIADKNADLAVMAGNGEITVASAVDQQVNIVALNGASVMNVNAKAGQTYSKAVPAGIYVVNGVKIMVK